MSGSTTLLDLIAPSQAAKELVANCLFDAASPAMLFGRRASTSAGLTLGLYGGIKLVGGVPTAVANQSVTVAANATSYILETDGVISAVTVMPAGWPGPLADGATAVYEVVAGADTITSYTDWRAFGGNPGPAGAPGADGSDADIAAHEAALDPHPQYMTQAEADTRYQAQPFDLTAFYPGVPTASVIVTRVPVARVVTFPASLTGSVAKARIAATAQTDFDVQLNGASVGTIRFAAAGTTASFIAASPIVTAAGDILSIIAPSSADATIADIGFCLTGTR